METVTNGKKEIIKDGPDEWELMSPLNRKRIIFTMENKSSKQFAMTEMGLKSGTRCTYTFTTEGKATGEYDARTREGKINYPAIITSKAIETTPKIGTQ